jgi:methyltransferase (TIGR00027 family)
MLKLELSDPMILRTSSKHYQGSKTARFVCNWRASAHALGFGPDPFAQLFIDKPSFNRLEQIVQKFKELGVLPIVHSIGSRDAVILRQETYPRDEVDMLSYIHTRTCFFDEMVKKFIRFYTTKPLINLNDSIISNQYIKSILSAPKPSDPQCNFVVMGAGFDMRSYRLGLPDTVLCYEVDFPTTQIFKRSILHQITGLADSSDYVTDAKRLTYIPSDLSIEYLMKNLELNGFNNSLPSVFISEGVFPYLVIDAVLKILSDISNMECPAIIMFDTVSSGFKSPHPVRQGMKKINEPWLFEAEVETVYSMCADLGLQIINSISVSEGTNYYMPKSPDGISIGFGSTEKRFFVAANKKYMMQNIQIASAAA